MEEGPSEGESDSKKMKMTGEIMIRALSAVRTAVHHDIISEEEYIKKYSDFVGKKDDTLANKGYYNTNSNYRFPPNTDESNKISAENDEDDCGHCGCLCLVWIVFIVGIVLLCTSPIWGKPSLRN